MITCLNLGKYGRLGNQLFQYAAIRGIAEKIGTECKIPDYDAFEWHGQRCLLQNFNIQASRLTPEDYGKIQRTFMEPDPNKFYPALLQSTPNTNISGFFQFVHYFEHCEELLRKEFTPKDQFLQAASAALEPYRSEGYETVSIHIRRGDMMTVMYRDTGVHPDQVYGREDIFDQSTIYGDYLQKAMGHFKGRKVKYFVFAGGMRDGDDSDDIEYIRRVFAGDQYVISETNDAMSDFTLMMSCDHNITCHQTTFGWWAAHLNDNPDKIVTSPAHYHFLMPRAVNNARINNGHFPPDWRIIE